MIHKHTSKQTIEVLRHKFSHCCSKKLFLSSDIASFARWKSRTCVIESRLESGFVKSCFNSWMKLAARNSMRQKNWSEVFDFLSQKFYLQNSTILLVLRSLQLFLKTVLIKKESLLPIANFHSTKSIWTSKKLQLNNKSWQNIFETNRQVNDFLLLLMLLNVYSRHDLVGWFFLTFSEAFTGFIIYFDSPMSWI